MKYTLLFALLLSWASSFAQDTIEFQSHKGKTFETTLPAHGMVKLKNGEKHSGLITVVTDSLITIKLMTDDEGAIREAKKNKVLTDEQRNGLLFVDPMQFDKQDVESLSFLKKRNQKSTSIKKGGIYILMGLAGAAAVLATIQDIDNNQFPVIGVGSAVVITGLVLLIKKSASQKIDFYKWKLV